MNIKVNKNKLIRSFIIQIIIEILLLAISILSYLLSKLALVEIYYYLFIILLFIPNISFIIYIILNLICYNNQEIFIEGSHLNIKHYFNKEDLTLDIKLICKATLTSFFSLSKISIIYKNKYIVLKYLDKIDVDKIMRSIYDI